MTAANFLLIGNVLTTATDFDVEKDPVDRAITITPRHASRKFPTKSKDQ